MTKFFQPQHQKSNHSTNTSTFGLMFYFFILLNLFAKRASADDYEVGYNCWRPAKWNIDACQNMMTFSFSYLDPTTMTYKADNKHINLNSHYVTRNFVLNNVTIKIENNGDFYARDQYAVFQIDNLSPRSLCDNRFKAYITAFVNIANGVRNNETAPTALATADFLLQQLQLPDCQLILTTDEEKAANLQKILGGVFGSLGFIILAGAGFGAARCYKRRQEERALLGDEPHRSNNYNSISKTPN